MKVTIEITEQELKDLKLIRNYFGEHDKTQLEHLAYSELDKLVKKLQQADVSGQLPNNLILYRQAKKLDYAEFCKWINTKLGNLR